MTEENDIIVSCNKRMVLFDREKYSLIMLEQDFEFEQEDTVFYNVKIGAVPFLSKSEVLGLAAFIRVFGEVLTYG